jgi:hypothetical protein
MKNITILLIAALCFQFGNAQSPKLNDFEYVIVPMEFDFQSEPNEYQLNILSRVLLKEESFKVFMDTEERPLELVGKTCNALFLEVEDTSGFLTISVIVRLKDCYNNIVFESDEGKTKIKDYKEGYQDAIRKAFKSLSDANYSYDGNGLKSKKMNATGSDEILVNNAGEEKNYPDKKVYKFGGLTYWMVETENNNYEILSNSGKTNYAKLLKGDKGSYIFNSKTINGAAYFDAEGNLNVEYMDEDLDEIQTITFKSIN